MLLSSQFPTCGKISANINLCVQTKNNRSSSSMNMIRLSMGSGASSTSTCAGVAVNKEIEEMKMDAESKPKHIAIIMDGNRRWAQNRGLPVQDGHRAGGKALKQLILNCMEYGARVLSLFSFSTENWARPEEEVENIMGILEEITATDIHELIINEELRVNLVGKRRQLPEYVQNAIEMAEESSKSNRGMHLVVAANYSGRYDITEATKKIAMKVKDGVLQAEDSDHAVFEQHLETSVVEDFPNPDLLIRTSGELRISNYMLWQSAYSELYFCDKCFPDFAKEDLHHAISAFHKRQRRYGAEFFVNEIK